MKNKATEHASMFKNLEKLLGNCTPPCMYELLRASGDNEDLTTAIACTMLCSLDSDKSLNKTFYEEPLDALAACQGPASKDALAHMAVHSRNGRIQIEATKRLGTAESPSVKRLLHKLATEGTCNSEGFCQRLTADHMRIAAIEALRALSKPTDSDGEKVLEAIAPEIEQNSDSNVFKTGTMTLATLCKSVHLEDILDSAERCCNQVMSLRLLAACRNLASTALKKKQADISSILCQSLGSLNEHGETDLITNLSELTSKITNADLVGKLADTCSGQSLERGRGQIAAAAFKAYQKNDEHLARAYLRSAEEQANTSSSGECLAGLAACIKAGQEELIADRIVQQSTPGHRELLRSSISLQLFAIYPAFSARAWEASMSTEKPISLRICLS